MLESNVEKTFSFTMIDGVRPVILHTVLHHQLVVSLTVTVLDYSSTPSTE